MIRGIDHVVILVDDLEAATACYRSLGFTVTPGGRHPIGTHNALICFQDGSYFELIAFWDTTDHAHPFYRHLAVGPGVIAYALAADDLKGAVDDLRSRGLRFGDPQPGARRRPDGVEIAWNMAFLENSGELAPFLIEDVSERGLRVPDGEAGEHANGVAGITRLLVAVDDLTTATALYAGLTTAPEARLKTAAFDQPTRAAAFQVGPHRIELHEPRGSGPIVDQITSRGAGPYAVVLEGPNAREIQPGDSGGARLRIAPRATDDGVTSDQREGSQ
jgi:catechol 2,3-dioxygenase-like lactoylglutathione lyase family enzyme